MNQDPYEFDAKARNDQTSRDRTAKNKQVLKNHHSPSLAKLNFSQYRRVTPSRIDCLTKGQYAHPVVSLYLNISSDRTLQQKDIYQTLFNSLKHTALQERKTYLDSLDHEQHQSLDNDLMLIQQYLQDLDITDSKSVVLLKSNFDLQWEFHLNTPGYDYLSIDSGPYILPLLMQLDEQHTALVAHIEVDQARLYRYQSNSLKLLETIKSSVADLSLDASRPNKVQRHNYDLLNRHFKRVAQAMSALARRYDLPETVLIGDERIRNLFVKDSLTHTQSSSVTHLPHLPGSTEGEMAEQVYQALQQNEVAEEGYYLDMINREDGVVAGLGEVISAQNRHLIRSLLIDKELKQPGFYCDHDQYIATDDATCPICERHMMAIDNVVDKLVELASQYQVDYKIIRQRQDELLKFGGIAGTMYDIQ